PDIGGAIHQSGLQPGLPGAELPAQLQPGGITTVMEHGAAPLHFSIRTSFDGIPHAREKTGLFRDVDIVAIGQGPGYEIPLCWQLPAIEGAEGVDKAAEG